MAVPEGGLAAIGNLVLPTHRARGANVLVQFLLQLAHHFEAKKTHRQRALVHGVGLVRIEQQARTGHVDQTRIRAVPPRDVIDLHVAGRENGDTELARMQLQPAGFCALALDARRVVDMTQHRVQRKAAGGGTPGLRQRKAGGVILVVR